jgi:hypothetical protein
VDAAQQQIIAAPAWETAMRAKAREAITTLDQIEVEAQPLRFEVQGIPVELTWGENDARVAIAGATYQLRVPVAWITAP